MLGVCGEQRHNRCLGGCGGGWPADSKTVACSAAMRCVTFEICITCVDLHVQGMVDLHVHGMVNGAHGCLTVLKLYDIVCLIYTAVINHCIIVVLYVHMYVSRMYFNEWAILIDIHPPRVHKYTTIITSYTMLLQLVHSSWYFCDICVTMAYTAVSIRFIYHLMIIMSDTMNCLLHTTGYNSNSLLDSLIDHPACTLHVCRCRNCCTCLRSWWTYWQEEELSLCW